MSPAKTSRKSIIGSYHPLKILSTLPSAGIVREVYTALLIRIQQQLLREIEDDSAKTYEHAPRQTFPCFDSFPLWSVVWQRHRRCLQSIFYIFCRFRYQIALACGHLRTVSSVTSCWAWNSIARKDQRRVCSPLHSRTCSLGTHVHVHEPSYIKELREGQALLMISKSNQYLETLHFFDHALRRYQKPHLLRHLVARHCLC